MEQKKKEISIKEFLNLKIREVLSYDFSGVKASDEYNAITNGIEKYFAYMTVMLKNNFKENEKYDLFKEARNKVMDIVDSYGEVIDADSGSLFLQDVYWHLWEEKIHAKTLNDVGSFQGETLNSAATTLNKYYEFIEKELDKNLDESEKESYKRQQMITDKGNIQPVSKKYILSKYLTERDNPIIEEMFKSEKLEKFLNIYHSLGNYMPVPPGCNGPRGCSEVKDYWDLTLLHIYNYYKMKESNTETGKLEEIKKIMGDDPNKIELYMEWLDCFETWHNFIESNYLENFAHSKEKDYYPIEFWEGHFSSEVLPQNKQQCEEYFDNTRDCIMWRSQNMAIELLKKV